MGNIETPEVRYKWGRYDSYQFEENLSLVFENVAYWKNNLFLLPSGRAGKQFIEEKIKLMNEWLHDSPLKDIALKATMIMPSLLLQKPPQKSKSREHLKTLERGMELSTSGEILNLLHELEMIQKDLRSSNTPSTVAEMSKKFTREMRNGNVSNAMKLLTDNMQNGILPLNQKTLNQLKQKHPQGKGTGLDVLLTDTPKQVHPIKFEAIDADLLKGAAVRTRGGAGPSGLDADWWRKILITKQFGTSSTDLCKAIAEVIKKLYTTDNLSPSLEPFLGYRLLPLDKNADLCPIDIGEILRWQVYCVSYLERSNFISRFIAGLCRT